METVSYRSYQDMSVSIMRTLHKIPHDIDVVVGVPRSGALAAHAVALFLNKPVAEIGSFVKYGWVSKCGDRNRARNPECNIKKILVVEDSVRSGKSINEAKRKLSGLPFEVVSMGVFVCRQCIDMVDIYCDVVDIPRCFAWNVFHHPELLGKSCVDIDGVLCRDPSPEENDDGVRYREFIRSVEPKVIPSFKVRSLVTCRLEKYRPITEQWLSSHGVRYDKLVMLNLPDAKTRRRLNMYGDFKANEFRNPRYLMFIESSLKEARDIKTKCPNKTVFCASTMNVVKL